MTCSTWIRVLCGCVLLILSVHAGKKRKQDVTYWMSFKQHAHPGDTLQVRTWVSGAKAPVSLTLDLLDYWGQKIQPEQNFTLSASRDIQTILFEISEKFPHDYYYAAYIRARGSGGKEFEGFEKIYVQRDEHTHIFIQTDKLVYTPGQKVKFRAVAMSSNLTVENKPITITVYDPKDNKVATYTDLTSKKDTGVVEGDMMTSKDPPLGTWWITATMEGEVSTNRFRVLEYDVPKFDVRVRLERYYGLTTDEKINVKIVAKYLHKTPVRGYGYLYVTFNYYRPTSAVIYREFQLDNKGYAYTEISREEVEEMAFNATYSWLAERYPQTYTGAYLAIRRQSFTLNYRSITFRAVVVDTVMQDVSIREKQLTFYSRPLGLRFIAPTPPSYKPDLPITLYVEALTPDYNERIGNPELYSVEFKIFYYRAWDEERDGVFNPRYSWDTPPAQKELYRTNTVSVNSEGLAVWGLECDSLPDDVTYIIIEASSGDVLTTKYLYKYISTTQTFLQLSVKGERAHVGKPVTLIAESNKPFKQYMYQVMSKENVLMFERVVDAERTKKKEFIINVTQDMYPASDVVVFFEAGKGEVVAERLVLTVDGQMANELSLEFKKSEVKPGTMARLQVGAKPGSTLFLLGVDKACKMFGKGNDIRKEDVLEVMAQMSGSDIYWRNEQIWYYYYARDTNDVFQSTSMGFMTDGIVPGTFYLDDIPYAIVDQFTTTLTPPPTTKTTKAKKGGDGGDTTTAKPTTTTTPRPTQLPPSGDPEPIAPKPFEPIDQLMQMLPETWLFDSEYLAGETKTLDLLVPENPSSYVVNAFAVHPEYGLSTPPEPVELLAIKRLFLSLEVPPRVYRGEDVCVTAVTLYTDKSSVKASVTMEANSTAFDNVIIKRRKNRVKVIRESFTAVDKLGKLEHEDRKTSTFCVTPKVFGDVFPQVALLKGNTVEDTQTLEKMKVLPVGVKRSFGYPMLMEIDKDNSFTSTINIDVPSDATEDSLYLSFQVSGNLLGVTAENLRNLLRLPSATGDLNIANFAPAVCVYKYLKATNGFTKRLERRTQMFMLTALQTQYKSRRYDGSFSAFGNRDQVGSVRVTAAFIQSLAHAADLGDDILTVDQSVVNRAVYWLERQRTVDGNFREPGRDVHPRLKSKSMELTAFVTIALQEVKNALFTRMSNFYRSRLDEALSGGRAFLESNLAYCGNDVYANTIVAYALSITGSSHAQSAIETMESLASEDGHMRYWSIALEKKKTVYPWYRDVNPLSIEATSYALMTLLRSRSVNDVMPIYRWLNTQRGPYGGFFTLHDTLVGYEALCKCTSLNIKADFTPVDFEINWTCETGTTNSATVTVNKNNMNDMIEVYLPSETCKTPTSVTVKSKCKSIHTLYIYGQLFMYYNLPRDTSKQSFVAKATVTMNSAKSFVVTTCIRRTTKVKSSSTVIAKVSFPSGFDIDTDTSDFGAAGHVEFLERKAILYYHSLAREDECSMLRLRMTKGSVANNKQVPVRVFDLYKPDDEYTTFYTIQRHNICDVEPNYMQCH